MTKPTTGAPTDSTRVAVDHSTGTDKTMAVTRERNRITDIQEVRPLREVRKEFNQAWIFHGAQWQLHKGFDTVTMNLYLADKMDCPAIGIPTPPEME